MSANGIRPMSANGIRPMSANGIRPMSAHGIRPMLAHGIRPMSAHGIRPMSAHGIRPYKPQNQIVPHYNEKCCIPLLSLSENLCHFGIPYFLQSKGLGDYFLIRNTRPIFL
jgi:hypothetical protein